MRVYCSTGAFITRKNNRNFYLIRETAPALDCDGFELLLYESWDGRFEELENELVRGRVNVPVLHADKRVGELISRGEPGDAETALRVFERNTLTAARVGAKTLVLHLWGGVPSDRRFERNLAAYPALSELARRAGLRLSVENVVCGEASPLERLWQLTQLYPDALITYDTKMAQFHAENEKLARAEGAWLFESRRVIHLHVNDYAGAYRDFSDLRVLPIGAGKVDFDLFFNVLGKHGYTGDATVESTSCFDDGRVNVAQLNDCIREVRRRASAVGISR